MIPPDPAPMLRIADLTVRYPTEGGTVTALNGVSLQLAKGRTLGIVGESGSGKSTIALATMGLLPKQARIEAEAFAFFGQDLRSASNEVWRKLRGARIAMVFQDPFSVLNPSLRIGEQIGEGLIYHLNVTPDEARARSIALLDEVGIANPASAAAAYPHELSGGMRQRALIAGALAAEPELLVLDEPTTALDVTIEAQILDLLQNIQAKRGLAMMLISHNLGVVRRLADEVAVIYAGELLEQGPTAEIFSHPRHPYSKGLLAAIPRLGGAQNRLISIKGGLPDLRERITGCVFEPRCPFSATGCEAPQQLRADGGGQVRCHRASELRAVEWQPEEAGPNGRNPLREAGTTPILAVEGLTKSFWRSRGLAGLHFDGWRPVIQRSRTRAVDNISLTIAPGEVLGLVGESGSGKTTLGRTILRLAEADGGLIRIAGETVSGKPERSLEAMRRRAQIVFQNPDSSLNPRKTVRELIGRPLERFKIVPAAGIRGRVRELLELVRLPSYYEDRYPHQMSGGEKQRVGIARALASEPAFLVCDEPVSALDVSVQAAIVNLLSDLSRRLDVAYLFISHDLSVVAHLSDRIAVMYRGRIVETGTMAEITRFPAHPYSKALLAAVPSVDGIARERIRLLPDEAKSDRACPFASRCPEHLGEVCDTVEPREAVLSSTHRARCHKAGIQIAHGS